MPLLNSDAIKGRRCPICGAAHASCGLPYEGTPTDIPEASIMAEDRTLYLYEDKDGHTFQMTEQDGKDAGYTRVGGEPAPATAAAEESADPKSQSAAANKARQPADNK